MKNILNKLSSQKRLIASWVITIIVLLFVVWLTFKNKDGISIPTPANYSDSKFGWQLNYSPNWTLNPAPTFNNSPATSDLDIQFQLTHTSGCTLTWGKIKTYKSASGYGARFDHPGIVFREYVKNIYLDNKNFQLYSLHDENMNSYDDIMGAYIKNFPEKDSPYNLVLFNNNSKLNSSCVSDFLSLLKNNINLKGDLYTINPSSNGSIAVQVGEYSLIRDPIFDNNMHTALVFEDENGNEQVVQYFDPKDKIGFQLNLQLVGNNLYFINSTGQLSTTNIISKKVQIIDLPGIKQYDDSARISNFLVYGNRLFYLLGQKCQGDTDTCNLLLHEYSLKSKQDSVLANGITSSDIMGYDTISNRLYMSHIYNDECWWQKIQEYNFTTKKVTDTVSTISDLDCNGIDPWSPEAEEWEIVYEINRLLANQILENRHIKIKNGKAIEDPNSTDAPYGISIRYIGK